MTSTNYYNTFIEVAEDTKATEGAVPPQRGTKKSVASYEFEILHQNPYRYSSDDVIFSVFAQRNEIPEAEYAKEQEQYFSKGRPCFRASPLTKTYGWGVHADAEGKIAIYGLETDEYQSFLADSEIQQKKAMRSKRS